MANNNAQIVINLEKLEGYDENISAYSAHVAADNVEIGGLLSAALGVVRSISEHYEMDDMEVLNILAQILNQNEGMDEAMKDLLG